MQVTDDMNTVQKKNGYKKSNVAIPLILLSLFVVIMVVYTSKLIYNVAVLDADAVIEERIANVSSLVETHLSTSVNVLQITADSVQHMMISGSTPARIHEFLVEESQNITDQFGEDYHGLYGYIMSRYMDGLNWEPPEDYDLKSRDWYIIAREKDGEVAIVPPYVDAQTGEVIISITKMFPDRQNIISLDVKLNEMQELVNDLSYNGKGYGFIVDESGFIIAHTDEENKGIFIGDLPGGNDLLDAINEVGSGKAQITYGGEKYSVHVNKLTNNWHVVMVVGNKELYGNVNRQIAVNVLICMAVFILIVLVYSLGYRNEKTYTKRMEDLKIEEQKKEYETKVLKLEKEASDEANKAKSNFLANMSHEIRTPMNAILGMDEMIIRETKDPMIKKYALDIQSAGKTLLSIINDILDLSKIESGKMELVPVDYDLASVLNDVVNMTMKKARNKHLKYEMNVDEDIPSILRGDEIRIRQVILNITNNAIKYTEEGSVKIHVSFDKDKSMLTTSVTDTGMGIRKEDKDKLFSSFQRLDETKNRNIEGTGLGLNITKQLTEMMGGYISVDSEYGKGSVFTVCFKQEVVDDTPIGNYTERLATSQNKKEEFKPVLMAPKAKVLVVDDNEMNLEVITGLMLETQIIVTAVLSGQECIDKLEKNKYDIVFLDQMMPGMSGTQTLEILKERDLIKGTPIIALTADAIAGAKENYIREGFTDYLSKPIVYADLEEMLLKYLDKDLLITPEVIEKENEKKEEKEVKKDKPLVLVINESPDKLNDLKEVLSEKYKGVFVKDEESAQKFLSKHEVEFIIRGNENS